MGKRAFLVMIVILASLAVFVCPSAAQDIDISGMDNAQLMQLLQAIMQKLEEETDDKSPEAPPASAIETAPESGAEAKSFRIYENKKLLLEQIPDWYFIRNDPTEEEPPAGEKPTAVPDNHDPCIICPYYSLEDGSGLDCFSIC